MRSCGSGSGSGSGNSAAAANRNDSLFGFQARFGSGSTTIGIGHFGIGASSTGRRRRTTRRSASVPLTVAIIAVAAIGWSRYIHINSTVMFGIAIIRTTGNGSVVFVLGCNGRRIRLPLIAIAVTIAAALFQLVVISVGSSGTVYVEEFAATCHDDRWFLSLLVVRLLIA